ncbi:MAG: hypothetical protein WCW31_03680 [Patescibacteria group bacterium]|jgi:tetratricopeptide (TPR) repeat protein
MPWILLWIFLALAVLCAAAAFVVLYKHWPEIRLLDPDSIKEEKERQKRNELVQERFKRFQTGKTAPIKYLFQRAVYEGKTAFHGAYLKLIRLNKLYEQAKAPFAKVAPSQRERMKTLLDEARSLARDLKWAEAEKRYLEVLLMDNRNPEAYKGIGLIYLKQRILPQAKETFEYLIKMKQADDAVYAGMAEVAELEGNLALAEDMRRQAVELRPRLSNRHAELAKFYMERGDASKAWPSAKRATDLEPKSAKYQELALECLIQLGDHAEAKKRYEKLRLLSEDHQRLQKLKERIEKIRVIV